MANDGSMEMDFWKSNWFGFEIFEILHKFCCNTKFLQEIIAFVVVATWGVSSSSASLHKAMRSAGYASTVICIITIGCDGRI